MQASPESSQSTQDSPDTPASPSYGPLMLDLKGCELLPEERDLLQSSSVGGVILFTRNYQEPAQLEDLVGAVREANANLIIAVDQEGGRVQRFRNGFTRLPALHDIGDVYRNDPEQGATLLRQAAWLMAAELLRFDIDISFAPVLDLYSAASEVIAERALSADPAEAVAMAGHYIAGLHEAGMCATGKHYPGHGTVVADSHLELPVDERAAEEILNSDYRVFADLIEVLDAVMPAHVRYPALDKDCAGFSKYWLQEKLRTELQFTGVIFSDDLIMSAAHVVGDIEQRVELALAAGCDMALVCNDPEAARQAERWLQTNNVRGSDRLATLRALPSSDFSDLHNSQQWQQANDALADMYEINDGLEAI